MATKCKCKDKKKEQLKYIVIDLNDTDGYSRFDAMVSVIDYVKEKIEEGLENEDISLSDDHTDWFNENFEIIEYTEETNLKLLDSITVDINNIIIK